MKKRIFHNWGLKLASLLLASLLWFVAAQIADPKETVYFSNIPVTLTNTELLEKEGKVYEILDNTDTVRVTIRAPRSITRNLRASDIIAEADMNRLTDINTIVISYNVQNVQSSSVETIRGDHDVVRLTVEDKSSKWIRVQHQTVGEVAEGYMVASVSPDQNLIEVTGPKSAVERIAYARVEVDVTGVSTNMSLNVEPLLYDSEGKLLELPSVSRNVDQIHMSVEVLATKEVPIELNVMGVPAEGYLATGVTECVPSTVMIAGTPTALASVTSISIPEEQLNITGASGDMVNVINIKDYLKDNVRLADSSFNGRVTATVYIEPIVERDFVLEPEDFTLLNVPEGYETEIIVHEDSPYQLMISGLNDAVSAVQESAVRTTIDIAAWLQEQELEEPGDHTYEIPVKFSLPDGVTEENEVSIRVKFTKTEVL